MRTPGPTQTGPNIQSQSVQDEHQMNTFSLRIALHAYIVFKPHSRKLHWNEILLTGLKNSKVYNLFFILVFWTQEQQGAALQKEISVPVFISLVKHSFSR